MPSSIPASSIVNVLPQALSAGGAGLDLVGLVLTTSTQAPYGQILTFTSSDAVAAYFGTVSSEYAFAQAYFAGYVNSFAKPRKVYFVRYASAAIPAFLRGATTGLSLTALQALSGVLTLTVSGTAKTSATINLSAATSFSNAATLIQAGFTSPGFTVSYDPITSAFVFTNTATGTASTLTVATGTLASALGLDAASSPVLSQGAAADTPSGAMNAVIDSTTDFITFSTAWEPQTSDKVLFGAWASSKAPRYGYVGWSSNIAAAQANDTTSFGALCKAAGYDAVIPIYDPVNPMAVAAFFMGAVASVDTSRTNGRATLAFRQSSVVGAGVVSKTVADNLKANGYNFIGSYATAASQFVFAYPGQMSGDFPWIDSFYCQAWMGDQFQLQVLTLMTNVGQIPYNDEGYTLIRTALQSVVNDALNFGAIRNDVTLSEAQASQVNYLAGADVAQTIETQGYYISVTDPGATVRAQRGSPTTIIFYTDGQSVQQMTLPVIGIQ